MMRALLSACFVTFVLSAGIAQAGDWSVLGRFFQPGPSAATHSNPPCGDCQMSWQPVRSVLHPNVLPPGMWRPAPLHIPRPWVIPPTPSSVAQYGPGCPHCR
jgi:hypothetical protein